MLQSQYQKIDCKKIYYIYITFWLIQNIEFLKKVDIETKVQDCTWIFFLNVQKPKPVVLGLISIVFLIYYFSKINGLDKQLMPKNFPIKLFSFKETHTVKKKNAAGRR